MKMLITIAMILASTASYAKTKSTSIWKCDSNLFVAFASEDDPGTVLNSEGKILGKLKLNAFDSESGYMLFKGKTFECSYSHETN